MGVYDDKLHLACLRPPVTWRAVFFIMVVIIKASTHCRRRRVCIYDDDDDMIPHAVGVSGACNFVLNSQLAHDDCPPLPAYGFGCKIGN